MILGALDPTAVQVMSFIGSLFFLAAGYNQVMKIVDRMRGQKMSTEISGQPLEVRIGEGLASERDCLARYQANEREIADLKRHRDDDLRIAGASRKGVYSKIEEIRRELSDKIDNVPDRVIATLKNTGAI